MLASVASLAEPGGVEGGAGALYIAAGWSPGLCPAVSRLLSRGSSVLVAGGEWINRLLDCLGVGGVEVTGGVVAYPLGGVDGEYMVPLGGGLYLYRAGTVAGGRCMAWSPPGSFLDLDGDGVPGEGEPWGPFCMAALIHVGGGLLYIVPSPSILENRLYSIDGGWVRGLAPRGGRIVLLYEPSPRELLHSASPMLASLLPPLLAVAWLVWRRGRSPMH